MKLLAESLTNRDAKALSFGIWNSMEPVNESGNLGIYPVAESEKIIGKYNGFFDLESLSFDFTGKTTLENGDGYFIFAFNGQKGSEKKQHEIRIIYGDGQVGVEDEWIPAMYGEKVQQQDLLDMATGKVMKESGKSR